MRTLCLTVLCLMSVGACAGEDVDASNDCLKALYDTCATEHDCTSGNCRYFTPANFSACTQTCDVGNPCPADSEGTPAECNANGVCEPADEPTCRLAVTP